MITTNPPDISIGRDASRAFIDLCFTPECLEKADDLSNLSDDDKKAIDDWFSFFNKEVKYPWVGYVIKEKNKQSG